MTATYQSIGTVGSGSASATPGLPASLANGDLALIMAVAKPDTATINTPSGWTLVANVSGGGGTTGSFTGPTRQAWFSRVKDASWSTAPAVTLSSGQPIAAVMARITLTGGGSYDVTAATGVFGTAAAVTNCAATLGSDPGITSGDLLLGGYSSPDHTATWSAEGASAPGVTIGAATERSEAVESSSFGNVGGMLFTASATAGTSTGVPSTAATCNVTSRGTVTLVRVREGAPVVPEVTASLTGSGALSAAVVAVGLTAASLTGSGAFTAQSTAVGVVAAPLTGSGEFTATVGTAEVDANLTGSGAFTAQSSAVGITAAPLTGSGAFTATATSASGVSADLTGSGAFTAEVETFGQVLAKLTGSGAFSADTVTVAVTDIANRAGGRRRGGYAVATWDPPIAEAPPTIVLGEAFDKANAHGPVTMNGTQAVYDVEVATKQRHRDRIIVGGKDVTYWRDVRTPLPTYQLVSPLLYGPATLRLPQVAAAFEQVGTGDLSWLQVGKPVKVQRVDPETGAVAATDYKGLVIAFNASGRDLTVEIGGEASGRAALMEKQVPIFRSTHDIGQIAAFALMPLKVAMRPHRGPTTGIKLARFGGTGWLDYISQLCARAWTRSGAQWTIMPAADGVYEMHRKDTTTVDATAYLDDARTVADLRRDIAEEPNRIFVTGITPEGQRVMFAVFPGLLKTYPAPYPFHDGRTFGAGTTDADTATGDGITIMVKRLNMFGIIDVEDAPGGFDADVTKAIRDLQEDAELPVTGDMNPATWRRLYDLDVTGYTLRASAIEPAAQKSYTKPWLRSPSGGLIARNPNYDPRHPWVDRVIDLGSGFTKSQMREFARAELDHSEDNWLGTVTFHTGALVAGSHGHSFTPTAADVFRARRLKPGMNIRLPHSPGGDITVHVSAVSVDEDGKVTATVDTRARDSMAVWEVIERNRESRRDPARQWIRDHRASGQIKDAIDGWWAPGGKLGNPITVPGHTWTVVELIAGQEGTVQAIRMRTNPNAEYVMAVFGKHVHPKRLTRLIGNPLTKRGTKRWTDEGVRNQLDRSRFLLYVAGDDEQPLGYYPKTKRPDTEIVDEPNPDYDPTADPDNTGTDDEPTIEVEHETGSITPLTGRWEDAAGFSYRTFAQPVIYVAVYADRDTVIPAGRVMWPQLEAGA